MDSSPQDCVNPAELLSSTAFTGSLDAPLTSMFTPTPGANDDFFAGTDDFSFTPVDSAVDLHRYYAKEPEPTDFDSSFDNFFQNQYSTPGSNPTSNPSNTPSPHGDMIFSNANSPGDFARDQSQTSSPETNNDLLCQEAMACQTDDSHLRSITPDAIYIPQSIEPPTVSVFPDKTKTRAETQIKMTVILDPLPDHFKWARFPRSTLSKPKQLASDDEIQANERRDGAVRMGLPLVCATAVDKKEGMDLALRRARGEEKTPRRPQGVAINEIDMDDPAHPHKGGAILICEGCKERERKRYDRKKKRNEDENEWTQYEDDRVIIVNEKEFKRWQVVESDGQYTSAAKKVEFPMRIACYCRHQEEKSPVGYRVIFTFMDGNDAVLSQHASEIILITDDHKNKETPADVLQPHLTTTTIPTMHQDSLPSQYTIPLYQYNQTMDSAYSQPTTPVMPQFQSPMTSMGGQFNPITNHTVAPQMSRQTSLAFSGAAISEPAPTTHYPMHQRNRNYYSTPMLSPTCQFPSQVEYPLHRPHSLDNFSQAFSFSFQQAKYSQRNQYLKCLHRNTHLVSSHDMRRHPGDPGPKKRARAGFYMCGGDLEE